MSRSSKTINKKKAAIKVEKLSVAFGDISVLRNVSFDIPKGVIAALIGPNGSGKTTLMKAILGIIEAQNGEVLIDGKHIHDMRDRIGYVPQKFQFDRQFPITVKEFLQLNCHKTCPTDAVMKQKLDDVGLKKSILDKQLGTLSGGQLQRVLIAQAIMKNPDYLFLDEPSTGIDIVGEAEFYSVLKHLNEEHDTTILLVSHDIAIVSQLVDYVICVNKKLLCSGVPKKALTQKTLEKLYGSEMNMYQHHNH